MEGRWFLGVGGSVLVVMKGEVFVFSSFAVERFWCWWGRGKGGGEGRRGERLDWVGFPEGLVGDK